MTSEEPLKGVDSEVNSNYLLISFPGVSCILTMGVPSASYRIVIPGVLPNDSLIFVALTAILFSSVFVLSPTWVFSCSLPSADSASVASLSLFSASLLVSESFSPGY